ncbi:NADPH:quinone reductase [Rhizocola hellebori]|uniref:NADPH:quinone reductase n=1 Tax=Rhizocola hellebori TaxID=1392758 RepID=A0A8J3VJJ8_9ACTN|nr:NAD(P)-dependent alcohol dehydrogenase [Rhizocola hellebori]GIH08068.1 NADPH:quinone reductase [Rhizocola hellebori]
MKAITHRGYGPPELLRFEEVDPPVPGDGDLLVRVHAAGVDKGVAYVMRGEPYLGRLAFGLRKPKRLILGRDVAGTVEAAGKQVTGFKPGDEIYAEIDGGSYAEYVCVPAHRAALKPANLSFAQAAAVPVSGNTALMGIRDSAKVVPGQTVLIIGASGGVGTFAVQIAKSLGAQVIAVCSTGKIDLVRSIGADRVIDYRKEDFTTARQRYDVILDLAGTHSLAALRRSLAPQGTLVLSSGEGSRWIGPMGRIFHAVAASPFTRQKLQPLIAKPSAANLNALTELFQTGKVTPVIDRTYPLSQTADALRRFEAGAARGKLVVTVLD